MIWVAGLYRQHPDAFIATMRAFGVSLSDLGGSLAWAELAALTRVASTDTTTYLGAAVAKWAYRASMPDVVSIAADTGKKAERFLPWGMAADAEAAAARRVTASEVKEAQARLSRVSAFRKLDGFSQQ